MAALAANRAQNTPKTIPDSLAVIANQVAALAGWMAALASTRERPGGGNGFERFLLLFLGMLFKRVCTMDPYTVELSEKHRCSRSRFTEIGDETQIS